MNTTGFRSGYLAGIALNTAEATTAEIPVGDIDKGVIHIPVGSSITSLTYYTAKQPGITHTPLYTAANVAVTQTVAAGKSYRLPTEVEACSIIKIVTNASGSVDISGILRY